MTYENLSPEQKADYHYAQALEWQVLGFLRSDWRNACFEIANQHVRWAKGICATMAN